VYKKIKRQKKYVYNFYSKFPSIRGGIPAKVIVPYFTFFVIFRTTNIKAIIFGTGHIARVFDGAHSFVVIPVSCHNNCVLLLLLLLLLLLKARADKVECKCEHYDQEKTTTRLNACDDFLSNDPFYLRNPERNYFGLSFV